ncbi:MAG: hypothetical protein ACC653_04855 [Gammaproteobacteria bacterium]
MTFYKSRYYFIALLFLVFIAFWESYFSKLFDGVTSYIHFHAITMLLWVFMLITQVFLLKYNRHSLHKIIGRFSYGLVPLLVISLILLAHSQITIYDFGITYTRLYILFLQLSLLAIFIIAYSLAIFFRKSPVKHARYMISTSLTLIDPAVARLPLDIPPLPFSYQVVTFSLIDLILIVLIVLERNQTKGREVFPIMLGIFLIFQILNLVWTDSTTWDSFALWFANLPLT